MGLVSFAKGVVLVAKEAVSFAIGALPFANDGASIVKDVMSFTKDAVSFAKEDAPFGLSFGKELDYPGCTRPSRAPEKVENACVHAGIVVNRGVLWELTDDVVCVNVSENSAWSSRSLGRASGQYLPSNHGKVKTAVSTFLHDFHEFR